jgi:3-dehydroquinate synthase
MKTVTVNLLDRSYQIQISPGLLAGIADRLEEMQADKAVIITDNLVYSLYGKPIISSLKKKNIKYKVIKIPVGEEQKKINTVVKMYDKLVDFQLPRDGVVIALGGGVIGDIAGFVAATYMRGVKLVQVPTTLLAQVDSAVGGKTGVNHPRGKNMIGSFYQPKMVIIDVLTLLTLPQKEVETGLAEVVKYGIIEDESFFNFLEKNSHLLNAKAFKNKKAIPGIMKVWETIVEESCKIKAKVVSEDEREETGRRMILNLGHTFGHAFEALTNYSRYRHGEAVSIGLVAASRLAERMKLIKSEQVAKIIGLLKALNLPVTVDNLPVNKVLESLNIDKKVRQNKINFVVPTAIGKVKIIDQAPLSAVKKVLIEVGCS